MHLKAELRGMLFAAAGVVALVLLISVADVNIPGVLLLQSLYPQIVAGALALTIVMLIFGMRWRAVGFVALVFAVIAYAVYPFVDLHERRLAPTGARTGSLTVLSYNVLSDNPRPEEAVRYIMESGADVAVIMESPGIEEHLAELATVYPYRVGCERTETCDLSIHSRHPIMGSRMIPLRPFRFERLAWVRIAVDGVPVTVAGVHQSKPYFDNAAWQEVFFIRRELVDVPGPMVLAGDFNSAPWSGQVVQLADRLELAAAPWHPATWPVRAGPLGVPIDNMFTRGNARIVDIAAGEDSFGSNHRSLLARVELYADP